MGIYKESKKMTEYNIYCMEMVDILIGAVSYANRGGKSTGYPITRPNKLRRFLRNYEQYIQQGTPI